jgi:acetoin utilization deacetylase AcuC-like enzyme
VLRLLLRAHPELGAEAERLARDQLDRVSVEAIAEDVEAALRALDVDDLNSRAGVHDGDYTDPSEAAWALLDEAVEPHMDDVRRRLAAGMHAEALATLRGILTGLYAVRDGGADGSVLAWAPDWPHAAAADVVAAWRAAGQRLPARLLDRVVPDWAGTMGR